MIVRPPGFRQFLCLFLERVSFNKVFFNPSSLIKPLWFFFFYLFALMSAASFADEPNENLIEDLKKWVREEKKLVKTKKDKGNLVLSGEVRTELQSTNAKLDGIKQGDGTRNWDIELRLQLDYQTDRTWGAARLRFDNDAGLKGTSSKIKLDRAFYGANIINASDYTVALQAGRWDLSLYFDSQIQFLSLMDGILLKYNHALDRIGDFYIQGGPFVVDEKIDQFAYIGETGVLDIGRTGLYAKTSFIDWNTRHTKANELRNLEHKFFNWQFTLGYKWMLGLLKKPCDCFAAYLVNASAKKLPVTHDKKANMAWYAGFRLGTVEKQWDWSLQLVYQWVEAQAVPGFDLLGIGHGNASGAGLYGETVFDEKTKTERTTLFHLPSQARGNTNYRGFSIIFQHMLTNNLTVYHRWQQSTRLSSKIGVPFSYKQYEIELIYGF